MTPALDQVLTGRARSLVELIVREQSRINALGTGRLTFHVSDRRIVLEVTEVSVAEAHVPK